MPDEIQKRGPGRPPKEDGPKMMPFVVLRDYWPTEDERVRKGTVVEMAAEDALGGIESGALRRA